MTGLLISCALVAVVGVVALVVWALCRISALSWRDEKWIEPNQSETQPKPSVLTRNVTRNQAIRQRKALREINRKWGTK